MLIVTVEVAKLFSGVVKTERKNTKPVDQKNDLVKELEEVWSVESLARVNLKMTSACKMVLEVQEKNADTEICVDGQKKIGRAKKNFCSHTISLESSLKAKRYRTAHLKTGLADAVVEE